MFNLISPSTWCISETLVLCENSIYEVDYCIFDFENKNSQVRHAYRYNCKVQFLRRRLILYIEPWKRTLYGYPKLLGFLKFENNTDKVFKDNNIISLKYENEVEPEYFNNSYKYAIYHSILAPW